MAVYLGSKKIASGAISSGGSSGGGGDTTPIGVILEYPIDTPPDNWLICDGSAVSRSKYSDLFAVIGTTYGSGNGSTTFNLPNLKGRVPVGKDSSQTEFAMINKTGGEKTHKLTINELASHAHSIGVGWTTGSVEAINYSQNNGTNSLASKFTGGDQPHNNLQPYIVVNYIIKATKEVATSSINEIYNAMWPVGRGFIDFTDTDYSNWLGFTWERELVGMTAVGLDTTQTEFNTIGKTGGSKDLQKHSHEEYIYSNNYNSGTTIPTYKSFIWSYANSKGSGLMGYSGGGTVSNSERSSLGNTSETGTGTSGNLQPYKVVAYWKRVA